MQHKKKPHLEGIQEFRVTAYVKDLGLTTVPLMGTAVKNRQFN